MNKHYGDIDIPAVNNAKEAQALMDDWWKKSEQSVFYLIEKLNFVASRSWDYLSHAERVKFQKRFEWLSCYLRHYNLGEDCLHLVKEVPIDAEKDYRMLDEDDNEEDYL